jgi:hypothetical protein
MAAWIGHARRVGGRSSRKTSSPKARDGSAAKASLADVREWARENGYQVSDRGRVAAEVMEAYQNAH